MSGTSAIASTSGTPRWYVPTTSKFLAAILLMQGVLFLSAYYQWCWLNQCKGHTVLIAIAVTLFLLLGLAGSIVISRWFKRKARLSLATLMLMVPVMAIPCGWLAWEMELARQQQELVAGLEARGAVVAYEGPGPLYWLVHRPGGSQYLAATFTDDFFFEATYVGMSNANDSDFQMVGLLPQLKVLRLLEPHISEQGLAQLAKLEHLESLSLEEAQIADAGLNKIQTLSHLHSLSLRKSDVTDVEIEEIKEFRHLEWLGLQDTGITSDGVKRIRKELPNCRVVVSFPYPQR